MKKKINGNRAAVRAEASTDVRAVLKPLPSCLLVSDTKGHLNRVLFERFDEGPQYI